MAKSCDYQNHLHSFLDGALDAKHRQEFEAHLPGCTQCSKAVEAASGLKKLMQQSVPHQPEIWPAIKNKLPSICTTVQADLSAYFDGELSSQAEAAVGAHILKCRLCTGKLENMKTTGRLLAANFRPPALLNIDLWPGLKPRLGEDCAMVTAELSAYCDQQVDSIRHRAITAHLTDCSECSVKFLRLSSLGDKLRSFYLPSNDCPDLWTAIDSKLKVVPFRKPASSRYQKLQNVLAFPAIKNRRLAAAAAVASIIAFTGICISAVLTMSQRNGLEQISSESYLLDSLLSDMSNTPEAVAYEDHG